MLNRFLFHPLSRRLAAALAPSFVTPNMVSISGAVLVLAAGAFYSFFGGAWAIALGFMLHLLWHVADGADGDLARLTGKASPRGEMIDGACDYLSHALIYLFLAIHLAEWIGLWAYALGWASGLSRVAQSNYAESQRRTYLWRAYGIPWMKQARASGSEVFRSRGLLTVLTRGYLWLADCLSPASDALDRAAEEAASDPVARRRLTRLSRPIYRGTLRLQSLLGANPRTILLGFSMALGSPLWFFLAETTVLNLLLLVSIRKQRACNRAFEARLRD
jgi:phosphatidylglycerophosphate synthase